MTTIHEKYNLKQEQIQIIRRLDLIQKDKKAIFKLLKDIHERLLNLARKANEYCGPKLITLFEMMQTPPTRMNSRDLYPVRQRPNVNTIRKLLDSKPQNN